MSHRSTGFTRRQRISTAFIVLILMFTMALPAVAAPTGPAALPLIDHFDLTQGPLNVDGVTPLQTSSAPVIPPDVADPDILGGQRDLEMRYISGPSGTNGQLLIPGALSRLSYSTGDGVIGNAIIQWDGPDNSPTLDATGLCTPGCQNLLVGGAQAFRLGVLFNDTEIDVTIVVYTDATHFSTFTVRLPGGQTTAGLTKYYYWPFSSFTQGVVAPDGPASFDSVGAIEMVIDGAITPGSDLSLHFLELDDGLFEWGDLPEGQTVGVPGSYPTTLAQNGPRHNPGSLFLGTMIDTEADGQPTVPADGDDLNGASPDDEDGVVPTPGVKWNTSVGSVDVTVTGGLGCLAGWIDWNNNGNLLNPADIVLPNSPVGAGLNTLTIDVPGTANSQYYARFRLYEPDGIVLVDNVPTAVCTTPRTPTGQVENGEVEDYRWQFGPNAVTLSGMSASSAASPLALPLGIVTFLGVLIGGIVLARRPT